MFPLNTILAWNINIIINKKYDNNNIIIASRAYFLHGTQVSGLEGAETCTESPAKPEFLPTTGVSGYLPSESPI
jgi:hypothetical protein